MLGGEPSTPQQVVDALATDGMHLAVDRDAPARRLLDVVADLRAAGAGSVTIITERVAR